MNNHCSLSPHREMFKIANCPLFQTVVLIHRFLALRINEVAKQIPEPSVGWELAQSEYSIMENVATLAPKPSCGPKLKDDTNMKDTAMAVGWVEPQGHAPCH